MQIVKELNNSQILHAQSRSAIVRMKRNTKIAVSIFTRHWQRKKTFLFTGCIQYFLETSILTWQKRHYRHCHYHQRHYHQLTIPGGN
jgi:hypothetical protein